MDPPGVVLGQNNVGFACSGCGKWFPSRRNANRHLATCPGTDPGIDSEDNVGAPPSEAGLAPDAEQDISGFLDGDLDQGEQRPRKVAKGHARNHPPQTVPLVMSSRKLLTGFGCSLDRFYRTRRHTQVGSKT